MIDGSYSDRAERLREEAPRLLERLGRRGGFADLFYEQTHVHRLRLRQHASRRRVAPPEREAVWRRLEGAGLRLLRGPSAGYAATDDLAPAALFAAADRAAAHVDAPAEPAAVRPPHADLPAGPGLPDDAPDAVHEAEKAAVVQAAADAAFALDEGVRRVDVAYQDRVQRVFVATSEGLAGRRASTLVGLRVAVTLTLGGRTATAYAVGGAAAGFGYFFAHPPERLAEEAVRRARFLLSARPVPEGRRTVVLAGGWGGVWLHEAVGHLLEADTFAGAASPFAGRLGERVAPAGVFLVDDPLFPGGRVHLAFDDEGTPSSSVPLVEDGRLVGVLSDRRHAARLGRASTGHARCQDFRHPPLPRMTNLVLQPGPATADDLLAGVEDGLYVTDVGAGVYHPADGRFALDVLEGYAVRQGRLDEPVAGVRLVGSGPDALAALTGVAADLRLDAARGLCHKAGQVVPVSVAMPTIRVSNVECRMSSEG